MKIERHHKSHLSSFGLLMIAVITVDSLRNLPISAQFGLPLVTFYIFAGLTFFLPLGLLTSKLATRYPTTGGSYVWIQAAFGNQWGVVSIWFQWVYNMLWYLTIFPFIASTIAAVIAPSLETDSHFILWVSLALFWIITGISSMGIRVVSWVGVFCAILGTLLPMGVLIILAMFWLFSGHHSAVSLNLPSLVPNHENIVNLAFFANVLFSLMGLDIVGIHAGDIKNPKRTYPRVLVVAGFLIIITMTLSSLALCIVIPTQQIGLLNGLSDVMRFFFAQYHINWGLPLVSCAIIFGSFGVASSWIIGLARTLHIASYQANLPSMYQKLNRYGMPHNILILQAVLVTLMLSFYLLIHSVNNVYWVFSAMSAQLGLAYYVLLFITSFKLLKNESKKIVLVLLTLGVITSLLGVLVGFIPPAGWSSVRNLVHYEGLMLIVITALISPLYFFLRTKKSLKIQKAY